MDSKTVEELRGLLTKAEGAATRMAQNKSSLTDLMTVRSLINSLPALLDLATASLAKNGEDGELCKRLEIKADMIQLGEKIAYGSDSEIMREAATRIRALASEKEGLRKALLRLQTGAAVALNVIPEDQQEGVVGNFLAAIHRECCAGLCASKGADECKEATP